MNMRHQKKLENEDFRLAFEQEMPALAFSKAIDDTGVSRAEIARRINKSRAYVTQALRRGNLTIKTMSLLAWACGYQVEIRLRKRALQKDIGNVDAQMHPFVKLMFRGYR